MKRKLAQIAAVLVLIAPGSSWPKGESYPGDIAVIELGRKGDVAALAKLREAYLPQATKEQRFAIFVASRLASPNDFTNELVGAVLAGREEGWLHLDGYQWSSRFGEFFVADELAKIAATGHREAIRKLIEMGTWFDGGWAEIVYTGLIQCLMRRPEFTVAELARRSKEERTRLLESAMALDMTDEDVGPLLDSVRQAAAGNARVKEEIESLVVAERERRTRERD